MQITDTIPAIAAVTPDGLATDPALADALLGLNNAHATELSWLDADRMRSLVGAAYVAARIGEAEAFLLSFDQGAAYDSPNFLWFRDRYDRFVYVDRVVVAPRARGQGLARALYAALTARARADGHRRILCEVNAEPPNPGSDALHAALGFTPVGRAPLPGGDKIVRYLALDLAATETPAVPGDRA